MRKKATPSEGDSLVFGIHPVTQALESAKPVSMCITSSAPTELVKEAHRRNIPVENLTTSEMDVMTGGGTHQGIVLFIEGYKYARWDDFIEEMHKPSKAGRTVVFLDRITDPRNLGAVLRSAYLFGVRATVLPFNGSAKVTAGTIKSSVGAALLTDVIRVTNLATACREMREAGFKIVGLKMDGKPIFESDLSGDVVIITGSEDRGIRPGLEALCDEMISIPMQSSSVGSFNASVSAGIALYEVTRQKSNPH